MKTLMTIICLCFAYGFSAQAANDDGDILYVYTNDASTGVSYSLDNLDKLTFGNDAISIWAFGNRTDYEYKKISGYHEFNGEQSYLTCPDDHHPHMIDLGLPSGTKWACCNVDTDHPENQSPTNYGGYYAWGETNTKSTYLWSTYTHCDGSVSTCHNLGSDIAGTQYDVAHVKWGGSWVMPSKEQQDELINNCTSTLTTQNGVSGRLFTGTNGGSIFLPAASSRFYSSILGAGSSGKYWSSTQDPSHTGYACYLWFLVGSDGYMDPSDESRYYGLTVRPVSRN